MSDFKLLNFPIICYTWIKVLRTNDKIWMSMSWICRAQEVSLCRSNVKIDLELNLFFIFQLLSAVCAARKFEFTHINWIYASSVTQTHISSEFSKIHTDTRHTPHTHIIGKMSEVLCNKVQINYCLKLLNTIKADEIDLSTCCNSEDK